MHHSFKEKVVLIVVTMAMVTMKFHLQDTLSLDEQITGLDFQKKLSTI